MALGPGRSRCGFRGQVDTVRVWLGTQCCGQHPGLCVPTCVWDRVCLCLRVHACAICASVCSCGHVRVSAHACAVIKDFQTPEHVAGVKQARQVMVWQRGTGPQPLVSGYCWASHASPLYPGPAQLGRVGTKPGTHGRGLQGRVVSGARLTWLAGLRHICNAVPFCWWWQCGELSVHVYC